VDKRLWPPILAGAGALGILASTARENGRALDRRVYRVINTERGPLADAAFKGVTELGSIWASVGATAALASMSRRREAIDALGAATAMWGLGQVLKRAVLRPRPYRSLDAFRLLIEEPRGTTWPSSHPAVLLAFATVVARNLETPRAVRAGLGALAGAVGLSRVYLGVHYPADVAGGLLLGWGAGRLWSSLMSPRLVPTEGLRARQVLEAPFQRALGTVSR